MHVALPLRARRKRDPPVRLAVGVAQPHRLAQPHADRHGRDLVLDAHQLVLVAAAAGGCCLAEALEADAALLSGPGDAFRWMIAWADWTTADWMTKGL